MWYVYIVQCQDQTLYTGITKDIPKRLQEHNSMAVGAKYTRSRRPVKLVYSRRFKTRATASREESRIKKLTRPDKLKLVGRQGGSL